MNFIKQNIKSTGEFTRKLKNSATKGQILYHLKQQTPHYHRDQQLRSVLIQRRHKKLQQDRLKERGQKRRLSLSNLIEKCKENALDRTSLEREIEFHKRKDMLFLKQTLEVSHILEGLEDLDPKIMYQLYKTKIAQSQIRKEDEAVLSKEFHSGFSDPSKINAATTDLEEVTEVKRKPRVPSNKVRPVQYFVLDSQAQFVE